MKEQIKDISVSIDELILLKVDASMEGDYECTPQHGISGGHAQVTVLSELLLQFIYLL